MANPWLHHADLPPGVAAVMAALHLREPRPERLSRLADAEWREALDFCDRSRVTLLLRGRARECMPEPVRERTDGASVKNRERLRRIFALYGTLARRLGDAGIEFVALKGITLASLCGSPLEDRMQYDIDLYAPRPSALAARALLLADGYETFSEMQDFPTDHLPPLIRKTGWEWRGDYFDAEIPTAIELHYRFWDEQTERLPAAGVDLFFERRIRREFAGVELPALHPADALGYAALHVLRHLLRGDAGVSHIYELARILERHSSDDSLWNAWLTWHSPELRRLEAVAFRLAEAWFGCETGAVAREAMDSLPVATASWFEAFPRAPLGAQFHPNKHELWLHLSLIDSAVDRWRVARRRLLPARLPGPVDAVYMPESAMTFARRWKRRIRYAGHLVTRARRHAGSLPRTAAGALWWVRRRSWSKPKSARPPSRPLTAAGSTRE